MAKEFFKHTNFTPASLERIEQCNDVIDEYLEQGYRLTLRQLYYQLVSRDIIANEQKSYKNLGSLISDARLAGKIDWEAIEDRGRQPHTQSEFDNLKDLVGAALRSYKLPRWDGQTHYAELWVEKDALSGVLMPLAEEFHVTLCVNKGYSSQSAMYEAADRFKTQGRRKDLALFYLGDLDPSGEDMVRDIRNRMELFGVEELKVVKVALTMEQVEQYDPPPNPAKTTDSRAAGYIEKNGESSWEVDALPPNVLGRLIREAFGKIIDKRKMNAIKAKEEEDKRLLREAVEALVQDDEDPSEDQEEPQEDEE